MSLEDKLVMPEHFDRLVNEVKGLLTTHSIPWTTELEARLRIWLGSREHVYKCDSISALVSALLAEGETSWKGVQKVELTKEMMESAKLRRELERMSLLMEPYQVQTPLLVPGMSKLPDQELLRLADVGKEEQEVWVKYKDNTLALFKRKGITKEEEHRIIAAGDEDDPSYVVWDPKMEHHGQRGHRYKGLDKAQVSGKHKRTYGSKKEREGYEYKISGAVDGHSIQIQDDQIILGPFQADTVHWKTHVKTTDGKVHVYDDSRFLPLDESDETFIEVHPYNYYWENQRQGASVRQKAIEAPTMKRESSFLHYNVFEGQVGHPNDGKAKTHIYPIPTKIHYLIIDGTGSVTHHVMDNRLEADYSKPSAYDKTTNTYSNITGAPKKTSNATLGGFGAREHLELGKQADTSKFPSATVLKPQTSGFLFAPDWRKDPKLAPPGYMSPPPTPFHVPEYLEEKEETLSGRHLVGESHGDMLAEGVEFDETKKESKLKLTSIRSLDFSQLKLELDPLAFQSLQSLSQKPGDAQVSSPSLPTEDTTSSRYARTRGTSRPRPSGFHPYRSSKIDHVKVYTRYSSAYFGRLRVDGLTLVMADGRKQYPLVNGDALYTDIRDVKQEVCDRYHLPWRKVWVFAP